MPSLEEMIQYANSQYSDGAYKDYLLADDLKNATFSYRLNKVLEIYAKLNSATSEKVRIFDVGCSNGRFIQTALDHGFEAWGLEFSENAIAAAPASIRSRIYKGDANSIEEMGIGTFDIITAFDLIEHVFDPVGFLNSVRRLASKSSLFVFATPDASNLIRPLMGKSWSMLQPYQHTVLLSRKSAQKLLETAGLELVHMDRTKKMFTANYLFGQLQAVNPSIYHAYEAASKFIPKQIREAHFMVNIGEMMFGARIK